MADIFLQEALEIVKAQASVRSMSEEEIVQMVRSLSQTLSGLSGEPLPPDTDSEAVPKNKGIKNASVTCLECGKSFKLLTKKHLASHGLTAAEYREKWGIKRKTALTCKALQKTRREKMKEMQLWKKKGKSAASKKAEARG
ncbi:MAG: MucR family transcriptional regulator [Desulfovibrio sp.]|nr:MucR family transcriptional regulator [Desulfovibrio sp.]